MSENFDLIESKKKYGQQLIFTKPSTRLEFIVRNLDNDIIEVESWEGGDVKDY